MDGKLVSANGQRFIVDEGGNVLYAVEGHVDMNNHDEGASVQYMTERGRPGFARIVETEEAPTLPAAARR